jgi:flagellar hook-basal body complex protein FliE
MISATSEIGGAALRAGTAQTTPFAARGASPLGEAAGAGSDFASVFNQLASEAVDVLKTGEAAAIQGIRGQIGTQDVVEAVMAAEQTLQAAVAVRDKVVSAYLELSRMAI